SERGDALTVDLDTTIETAFLRGSQSPLRFDQTLSELLALYFQLDKLVAGLCPLRLDQNGRSGSCGGLRRISSSISSVSSSANRSREVIGTGWLSSIRCAIRAFANVRN